MFWETNRKGTTYAVSVWWIMLLTVLLFGLLGQAFSITRMSHSILLRVIDWILCFSWTELYIHTFAMASYWVKYTASIPFALILGIDRMPCCGHWNVVRCDMSRCLKCPYVAELAPLPPGDYPTRRTYPFPGLSNRTLRADLCLTAWSHDPLTWSMKQTCSAEPSLDQPNCSCPAIPWARKRMLLIINRWVLAYIVT